MWRSKRLSNVRDQRRLRRFESVFARLLHRHGESGRQEAVRLHAGTGRRRVS
jgi:hypothetical protein